MSTTADSSVSITVVVPLYNAEPHLPRCVEALLAQRDVPGAYEIVLVDNNSTDGSVAVVRRYDRVRLLSEPQQSSYAARNRGAAATRGRVLAFIDADCVADPRWLAESAAALTAADVQVVQGGRMYDVTGGAAAMLAAYEAERAAFVFARGASDIAFGYTNNMVVRRETFERCGPFDVIDRGADSLFVRRVLDEYGPGAVVYARDAKIRHLEIAGVTDLFRKKVIYGRSAYRNYEKPKLRHRDLTRSESLEILRTTARRHGYSPARTLQLALLLRIGSLCYKLGRASAKWRDRGANVEPRCKTVTP